MATYENKGRLTYKDENGDLHRLYPVTQRECVEGMEDIDAHLIDKSNPHGVDAEQTGAVPKTRTVNGKSLDKDISLNADDVGAVPTTRTINGKPLDGDIVLHTDDIGGPFVIDDTLTMEGSAADAKVAGDAIRGFAADVAAMQEILSIEVEKNFKHFYSLVSKTTEINKDSSDVTTSIVETGEGAVATTTFEETATGKIITTVVIPDDGDYNYTKSVTIETTNSGTRITETYTKEGK